MLNIETMKACLTIGAAMLLFLASFSFRTYNFQRRLVRLMMLVVFACAFGNVVTYADLGYRPLSWPLMMLASIVTLSAWLIVAPRLIYRQGKGGDETPLYRVG